MKIDILTLFPQHMNAMLHESILGRAAKKGIVDINCIQIRDYTENRQRQVDDYPYGGGWGCVLMAQPLKACLDDALEKAGERKTRVIYMSPQGRPFTQEKAKELVRNYDHLVLVCGHYEGVDERFIASCVDEEISLGDFVLTGGELAAMAVADCVCRLVPGVLADEECYTGESHWEGLLEYPQYTRPEVWEGLAVPEVLLGGNHGEIARWRRKQMLSRTMDRRPDLFEELSLSDEDEELLAEIEKDRSRRRLVEPVSYRRAQPEDIGEIMRIAEQARASLRRFCVDQWQGAYPAASDFEAGIAAGECYVMTYGGTVAGAFCLSQAPEPCYDALTDGRWRFDGPYAVLHRSMVELTFRGSGMSDKLIEAAEELTRSFGLGCIRADTHRKNKPMRALLLRHGFAFRGNVLIDTEPGHDPRRQAFEKLL